MATSPHKAIKGRPSGPHIERRRRALVYLRVGKTVARRPTSGPAGRGRPIDRYQDLALQESICAKAAEQLGATIVGTYFDVGVSAADPARPGYQRLLKRLTQRPRVHYVIAPRLDRLVQHALDRHALLQRLELHGAELVSAGDTAQHMWERILAALDQPETVPERRRTP